MKFRVLGGGVEVAVVESVRWGTEGFFLSFKATRVVVFFVICSRMPGHWCCTAVT